MNAKTSPWKKDYQDILRFTELDIFLEVWRLLTGAWKSFIEF
jgi:hypothetical protein